MANVDNPYGLRPVSHISGASWNGATRRCRIDSTAGDLGVGDAVVWNGSASGGYPEIVAATIGATALTTITATCIFFEIIGPILTKFALKKAGEIPHDGSK